MKIKMKPKFNSALLTRRLIFNSITVQWCAILLCLLFFFSVYIPSPGTISRGPLIPEARNAHHEPLSEDLPTIFILRDGSVYVDDYEVYDNSKLRKIMGKSFKERGYKGKKVLLEADQEAQFSRIVEILKGINKMNIEVVGLITVMPYDAT